MEIKGDKRRDRESIMTTLKQKVLRSSSREKAKSLHQAVAKSSKPASTSNLLVRAVKS